MTVPRFPAMRACDHSLRWALLGLAVCALVGAVAAIWVPILRLSFAAVCHQIPDRSFAWAGAPLAVCARCLGLYAGAALAAALPLPRCRYAWRLAVMLAAFHGLDWLCGISSGGLRFGAAALLLWLVLSDCLRLASAQWRAAN